MSFPTNTHRHATAKAASLTRPTTGELNGVIMAMRDMARAGIFTKAPRAVDVTVACAMAMRTGEFQSDNEAKRKFKIPITTGVRQLWVPRLEQGS